MFRSSSLRSFLESYYFIPRRFKYSLQHLVFKHT
jgi:hypothetical protein